MAFLRAFGSHLPQRRVTSYDLAPLVGASLEVMDRDAKKMRGERPFVFTNLKVGQGVGEIIDFVVGQGGL